MYACSSSSNGNILVVLKDDGYDVFFINASFFSELGKWYIKFDETKLKLSGVVEMDSEDPRMAALAALVGEGDTHEPAATVLVFMQVKYNLQATDPRLGALKVLLEGEGPLTRQGVEAALELFQARYAKV